MFRSLSDYSAALFGMSLGFTLLGCSVSINLPDRECIEKKDITLIEHDLTRNSTIETKRQICVVYLYGNKETRDAYKAKLGIQP